VVVGRGKPRALQPMLQKEAVGYRVGGGADNPAKPTAAFGRSAATAKAARGGIDASQADARIGAHACAEPAPITPRPEAAQITAYAAGSARPGTEYFRTPAGARGTHQRLRRQPPTAVAARSSPAEHERAGTTHIRLCRPQIRTAQTCRSRDVADHA